MKLLVRILWINVNLIQFVNKKNAEIMNFHFVFCMVVIGIILQIDVKNKLIVMKY